MRTFSLLAGLALAAAAVPAAAAPDGEKLYTQRCLKCHSVEKMRDEVLPTLGTRDEAKQRLEGLLLVHHAPDHAEHAAIIEWLFSVPPRKP